MKINSPVTQIENSYSDSANILSTTDLKGTITYVNDDFIDISGFEEDELIGRNHNVVRHPDMPPAAFGMLWANLKAGKSWMGLVKNRCKDGNHYWVDAYATPITENGSIKEYQSVRRKPSKTYVKRAETIYPALKEGKSPSVLKRSKIPLKIKAMLCALLPMLLTGIAAIFLDDMLSLGLALLLGTVLSSTAVMMLLKPLDSVIKKATDVIDDPVAQYVYTGRNDEIGRIQLALKSLESETAGLIGRIADSANSMGDRSHSLSEAVESSKSLAQQQFTETEQVAAAVNEMSASIQEVSNNAQNSSVAANNGLEEVEKGKSVVDTSVQLIEALKEEVSSASSIIRELEKSSNSIAVVLDVINEIAEQTNLLALNAAIEAARAGDAGRGFAVVADEVRSLANRTRSSTEEIREVVNKLQQDSSDAVTAMESGLRSADTCVGHGNITAESFNSILRAIEQINDMSVQIAAAVEEQSAVAEEISRSIHSIRNSSEENVKGAEHSSSISSHMVNVSTAFKTLANQFWAKQAALQED